MISTSSRSQISAASARLDCREARLDDTTAALGPGAAAARRGCCSVETLESRVLLSTYYVSASGGSDENAGSSDALAFRTLQKAADAARAGDTVVVRAGTYDEGMNIYEAAGGTQSAPITFAADPGAVITHAADSGINADLAGINIEGTGGWYEVRGFTIRSDGSMRRAGIRVAVSDHVTIASNEVSEVFTGIFISNSEGTVIEDNRSHDATDQHGIYVGANTRNCVVRGNTLYNNNWDGLHMNASFAVGPNDGALVEDNVIYGNGLSGMDVEGVTNATIRNNLVYDNGKHGITFHSQDQTEAGDPTPACSGNTVVNNTIVSTSNNNYFGIQFRPEDTAGTVVFNNVLSVGVGSNCGSISLFNSAPDATFASDYNVVAADGEVPFSTSGGAARLTLAEWRTATGLDAHSVAADPAQIFLNDTVNDFRLRAESPAVDAGTDTFSGRSAPSSDYEGEARPQGTGYEVGYDAGFDELPPGGGGPDTTAPTLSSVAASGVLVNGATVTWTTNEFADTQVEYGTTANYGISTTPDALLTYHMAILSDLAPATMYHYRVLSRDAAGNLAVSQDFTFVTAEPPPPADTTAPTASADAPDVTTAGSEPYLFTVTWSDDRAIDVASLDDADVDVIAPDGSTAPATFVSSSGTGALVTATYSFEAPGGTWDFVDNGTYTIRVRSDQVTDTSGNAAVATSIGQFVVNIARPANNVPAIASLETTGAEVGGVGEQQAILLSAVFADPDAADAHTVRVDWGDGTVSESAADPAAAGSVTASHAYASGGIYTAVLTVTDERGGSAGQSARVYVTGAGVRGRVLYVVGTAGADRVYVMQSSAQLVVSASFLPNYRRWFRSAAVSSVLMIGGNDNDRLILYSTRLPGVIDGGPGDDLIRGGHSSLLIGGSGADTISGGTGNDIVVAGQTSIDGDVPALLAVLSGHRTLNPSDVLDDGAVDTLAGNRGIDTFFGRTSGTGILDRIADYFYSDDELVWNV